MRNTYSQLLTELVVLNTGLNLPGPLAASQLADLGARVVKIEPPQGDPFRYYSPAWYDALHEGIECRQLDLKSEAGRAEMANLLATAGVLITSQRPAALSRMGLDSSRLLNDYAKLAVVNIVGEPEPLAHLAGHDLTYQAVAGLLDPPALPRTLLADLGGAQQAVIAALALYARGGGVMEVALSEAARYFQGPLAFGLTRPGALLGGGHAGYRLYRSADGWLALAALEPHFWQRLRSLIAGVTASPLDPAAHTRLSETFAARNSLHWQAWAQQHDIPLTPLPPAE